MPDIKGLREFNRRMHKIYADSLKKDVGGVIVGYTAAYALYVHEAPGKLRGKPRGASKKGKGYRGHFWDPQGRGQPKFLEQPAREKEPELIKVVRTAAASGVGLQQALYLAGLRLQRESQQLVPVDTGNLKASAFTRKD